MKRILGIFFAISLLLPLTVSAQGLRNLDKPTEDDYQIIVLPEGETIEDDYFAVGGNVEIYGTINGDAYIGGGQVTVDGTINGDLLVAGGSVVISGDVTEDVRIAGGNVTITGNVGDDLTVVGGNITITNGAVLNDNVTIVGGNVMVSAPVTGSLRGGIGNLTVSNSVGRNIEAGVGMLRLTSAAKVGGNVLYWSETEASIDSGAEVTGQTERREPRDVNVNRDRDARAAMAGADIFGTLISAATTILLGAIVLSLFPTFAKRVTEVINQRTLFSAGVGLLALILTPMVAVLLMITILGIPFGLILLLLYILLLYLSRVYVMSWIGSKIMKNTSPFMSFLVGLLVYYLVGIVPVIGPLVKFIAVLIGFGAMLIALRDFHSDARKKDLV